MLKDLAAFFVEFWMFNPLRHIILKMLDDQVIAPGSWEWRLLGALGFRLVHHQTGQLVVRRGQYVRWETASQGHRWAHCKWVMRQEEWGPTVELCPRHLNLSYENLPTALKVQRAKKGPGRAQLPPVVIPPVPVTLELMIVLRFIPERSSRHFFAVAEPLLLDPVMQEARLRERLRPYLERLTSRLNPLDLRLRLVDQVVEDRLWQAAYALRNENLRVDRLELVSVRLPEALEAAFVANQELLRQSVQHYSHDELSKMLRLQLGQGLRVNNELAANTLQTLQAGADARPEARAVPQVYYKD